MILSKLIKIELYTDDRKNPVLPEEATIRYVTEFKENVGIRKTYQEYSDFGWNIKSDSPIIRYYD